MPQTVSHSVYGSGEHTFEWESMYQPDPWCLYIYSEIQCDTVYLHWDIVYLQWDTVIYILYIQWRQLQVNIGGVINILSKCFPPKNRLYHFSKVLLSEFDVQNNSSWIIYVLFIFNLLDFFQILVVMIDLTHMYARADFTLLTPVVQRVGQSGRKLFPPAGLRKESNPASLFGYSLIVLISSLTVFIASRHMFTFESASWKACCGHCDACTLPLVVCPWRVLVSPTCSLTYSTCQSFGTLCQEWQGAIAA